MEETTATATTTSTAATPTASIIIKGNGFEIESSLQDIVNNAEMQQVIRDEDFCPYEINIEDCALDAEHANLITSIVSSFGYNDFGYFELYWNRCIMKDPSALHLVLEGLRTMPQLVVNRIDFNQNTSVSEECIAPIVHHARHNEFLATLSFALGSILSEKQVRHVASILESSDTLESLYLDTTLTTMAQVVDIFTPVLRKNYGLSSLTITHRGEEDVFDSSFPKEDDAEHQTLIALIKMPREQRKEMVQRNRAAREES